MAYKNVYQRLGVQMSKEFQLLAEEKWILEALTKIKNQQNCLQIERLHLESVKAKLRPGSSKNVPESPQVEKPEDSDAGFLPSALNLMQNVTVKGAAQDEVPIRPDDEAANEEQLDLIVQNAAFNMDHNQDMDMEEYEEDEESNDDMFIDMNMLMNGTSEQSL